MASAPLHRGSKGVGNAQHVYVFSPDVVVNPLSRLHFDTEPQQYGPQ